MQDIELLKSHKSFAGLTEFWQHDSECTKTKMKFSTFRPQGSKPTHALIFLSGLTCSEENFVTKSGIQTLLQNTQTMVICPDTSPRGLDLPEEHASYDFGSGAGFYVNATTEGYKNHYQMYDYINEEIYHLLIDSFNMSKEQISLSGHSMGGHGALVIGLRNPDRYKSLSAFSPIAHPTQCAWGEKAMKGYFGNESQDLAKSYDATELLHSGHIFPKEILIDQGLEDEFLEKQLLSKDLEAAAKKHKQPLNLRFQPGYDHSYYFIASFLRDHIEHHCK